MTKNTNWPWPLCRENECCDTDCTSQENQSLREQLGDLLALIHRDGGHHQANIGTEQALIDAKKALLDWRQSHDELVAREKQIVMLREALLEISQVACSLSPEQKIANEALAATEADLDGVILCERKSVAWFRPRTEGEAMNLGRGELMAIAAVRYCLGRRSYIVGDCVDWLIEVWPELDPKTRNTIRRDIEKAFSDDDEARELCTQHFPLGMDMDRAEWTRVRKLWKA